MIRAVWLAFLLGAIGAEGAYKIVTVELTWSHRNHPYEWCQAGNWCKQTLYGRKRWAWTLGAGVVAAASGLVVGAALHVNRDAARRPRIRGGLANLERANGLSTLDAARAVAYSLATTVFGAAALAFAAGGFDQLAWAVATLSPVGEVFWAGCMVLGTLLLVSLTGFLAVYSMAPPTQRLTRCDRICVSLSGVACTVLLPFVLLI